MLDQNFLESEIKKVEYQIRHVLGVSSPNIRSFFSSSFEPASYSLVGRLILNPNQPMILFNLLGLQRNLSKFEMNLPEIYLFSSPLLCLLYCFANISKYFELRQFFSLEFCCCFDLRRSMLYRFCTRASIWSILLNIKFPWFDGSKKPLKANLRKTNF